MARRQDIVIGGEVLTTQVESRERFRKILYTFRLSETWIFPSKVELVL